MNAKSIKHAVVPPAFYATTNVVQAAKDLLGKVFVSHIEGARTSGIIVETEAYDGHNDRASHAFGRRTSRTAPMFASGGIAYVYLCYGIHSLANVVTGDEGNPQAVLIRGIEPQDGLEVMMARRSMPVLKANITAGPGALCQAMGITTTLTGRSLQGPELWIEEGKLRPGEEIVAGTRVGVAYAQDHALLPYRFWIKGNPYVSKGKGL